MPLNSPGVWGSLLDQGAGQSQHGMPDDQSIVPGIELILQKKGGNNLGAIESSRGQPNNKKP